MTKNPDQKHNLPDLFKSVFDLYIPRNLSHGASNLMFALLYKFNQVPDKKTGHFFPEKLSVYNFELAKILGINEKTLIKLRNELTAFRLIPDNEDTWLIKYESGGTRESGFYQGNFTLLANTNQSNLSEYYSQNGHQLDTNIIQESQDIGNNIDATFPENSKSWEKQTLEIPKTEKSGQNVQPFITKQNETSSPAKTILVPSTSQPTEKVPIDSSLKDKPESNGLVNEDKLAQGRDASRRWRSPAELALDNNGKKPPAKPPDAESNFEFIDSQQRDVQLVLLKRLTEEKKKEFYEWARGQNKEGS